MAKDRRAKDLRYKFTGFDLCDGRLFLVGTRHCFFGMAKNHRPPDFIGIGSVRELAPEEHGVEKPGRN
jgi:hypothetical protein